MANRVQHHNRQRRELKDLRAQVRELPTISDMDTAQRRVGYNSCQMCTIVQKRIRTNFHQISHLERWIELRLHPYNGRKRMQQDKADFSVGLQNIHTLPHHVVNELFCMSLCAHIRRSHYWYAAILPKYYITQSIATQALTR